MKPIALLALIAIAAGGCSGDGHGAATTTTTRPATQRDTTHPNLAPCPTRYKDTALAKLNADIPGASTALVPFAATEWSICQWDGRGKRNGQSAYVSNGVDSFARDTNRLAHSSQRPQQKAHPRDRLIASQLFYLIFASGSQKIVLRFDPYGNVTNGYVVAQPTCFWSANFLAVSCAAPS